MAKPTLATTLLQHHPRLWFKAPAPAHFIFYNNALQQFFEAAEKTNTAFSPTYQAVVQKMINHAPETFLSRYLSAKVRKGLALTQAEFLANIKYSDQTADKVLVRLVQTILEDRLNLWVKDHKEALIIGLLKDRLPKLDGENGRKPDGEKTPIPDNVVIPVVKYFLVALHRAGRKNHAPPWLAGKGTSLPPDTVNEILAKLVETRYPETPGQDALEAAMAYYHSLKPKVYYHNMPDVFFDLAVPWCKRDMERTERALPDKGLTEEERKKQTGGVLNKKALMDFCAQRMMAKFDEKMLQETKARVMSGKEVNPTMCGLRRSLEGRIESRRRWNEDPPDVGGLPGPL
ncbi:hypothetical protein QBC35DRAFT_452852 [Podospora australis]|uniref:Uncharacterized protein n=1 Tax=Podospora australis TaxID=1536484 RepID=A0AAN6WRN6_9PEZI|nr:hypothetical protein QBC35DRAFT_452852 [Podospora australis]